jgi:hypothetical protein
VQHNRILTEYTPDCFGIAWDGQSEAVERLIHGYDAVLRDSIESQVNAEFNALRKTVAQSGGLQGSRLESWMDG